jgi:hypothetical protein
MEQMEAAILAGTSEAVQIWMNWMMIIFMASLIFVYKHVSARYIFGALVITLPIALFIFDQTGNINFIGIAHIIGWLPLSIYLIKTEIIGKLDKLKTPYGIYLVLLLDTILISLIFDFRDVALVMLGMK